MQVVDCECCLDMLLIESIPSAVLPAFETGDDQRRDAMPLVEPAAIGQEAVTVVGGDQRHLPQCSASLRRVLMSKASVPPGLSASNAQRAKAVNSRRSVR